MAFPLVTALPQNGSIVSRWKLDEASGTRSDDVGSNDLTDNNTVTTGTGPFTDTCADFEEGNTEYLSIADNASLSLTGDISFGCWIYIESSAGSAYRGLMSKFQGGSLRSYALRLSSSNQIEFFGSSTGSSTDLYCLVSWTPKNATWYHVGISYDASAGECKFFVNGAQQGATQTGLPTSIADTTADFTLGTQQSFYMDGLMSDAVIWNAELSNDDFKTFYFSYFNLPAKASFPQSASMVSRWTLTEDGGTRYDSAGTNHLAEINAVDSGAGISTTYASSAYAADFESTSNQFVAINDGDQTGLDDSAFTVAGWLNFESITGAGQAWMGKHDFSVDESYAIFFYLDGGDYKIGVETSSNGTTTTRVDRTITPTLATWYHYTFVFNGTSSRLYINGVQEGADFTLDTTLNNSAVRFELGSVDNSSHFDGLMQDVVFISVALTDEEVATLYGLYEDAATASKNSYFFF